MPQQRCFSFGDAFMGYARPNERAEQPAALSFNRQRFGKLSNPAFSLQKGNAHEICGFMVHVANDTPLNSSRLQ